jgi:hypothetical protein
MSGSSHVNLSFSGPDVHERKKIKWLNPISALLLLSPFEEDLALHSNEFKFPSCKNNLYQVWLKSTGCFILKDYLQYTHVKIKNVSLPTLGNHDL